MCSEHELREAAGLHARKSGMGGTLLLIGAVAVGGFALWRAYSDRAAPERQLEPL